MRPASPHCILVVEDDPDLRDSVAEALQDEGYSTATASDGLRALEYLDSPAQRPDLILLDLMMPNMNGFEFREQQLTRVEHASIPVVVMTADADGKSKAASLNVAGFLPKPVTIAALLELVARLLK